MKRCEGYTLLEIMMVVSIIGLLASLPLVSFRKARATSQLKACMNNMRQIESAKERWAMEYGKTTGMTATWDDILPYLNKQPVCPAGGDYRGWEIGTPTYCTKHDWRNNPDYDGFTP